MAKPKPLVLVTRKLPEVVETRMRELFDARLNVDLKFRILRRLAFLLQRQRNDFPNLPALHGLQKKSGTADDLDVTQPGR